jgi:hypothetical protein
MKKVTSFSSGSEESLERSAFDADEEGSGMLLSKKKRALRVPIDGDYLLTEDQILRRAVLELHQLPPSRAVRHPLEALGRQYRLQLGCNDGLLHL